MHYIHWSNSMAGLASYSLVKKYGWTCFKAGCTVRDFYFCLLSQGQAFVHSRISKCMIDETS